MKGARELARPELIKVLTNESADSVHWLQDSFGLDMSVLGRLGGHSFPRTHRGKEQFPGMTITYALMERMEEIAKKEPHRARVVNRAKATRLLTDAAGAVVGVEYELKTGEKYTANGPVVIATGGYGADFSRSGLLAKHRPDLANSNIATTNGEHCTGDGIRMAEEIGANTVDMKQVQVHPTGLVDPRDPDCKVKVGCCLFLLLFGSFVFLKWLAAEALRGTGALLLNGAGKRFCNELGHRDYVTGEMNKGKGPYRLLLNSACAKEIEWHCKHYQGRGLMEHYGSGAELAKAMGIAPAQLEATFVSYSKACVDKKDEFGKSFFENGPWRMIDSFYAAIVTPVVHYTMGGLEVNGASQVVGKSGPIAGLWCAGEVAGGVHGVNRLGGSSLLDCVVFGRVSGRNASKYVLENLLAGRAAAPGGGGGAGEVSFTMTPAGDNKVSLQVSWGKAAGQSAAVSSSSSSSSSSAGSTSAAPAASSSAAPAAADRNKVFTLAEVAKHNTASDCWVVVNGVVLDVTTFLPGMRCLFLFCGLTVCSTKTIRAARTRSCSLQARMRRQNSTCCTSPTWWKSTPRTASLASWSPPRPNCDKHNSPSSSHLSFYFPHNFA